MTSFSSNDIFSIHRSFIEAMMSEFISDLFHIGIQGTHLTHLNFFDISLAAFQSGVSEVLYRAAVETIAHVNANFKKIKDDPTKKSQTIVYLTGGSLGALFATGINYPINCVREFRNKKRKEFKMSFEEAEKFYEDKIFNYVGYATSMGNIVPLLPKSKSDLQYHFNLSHLNGILLDYPFKMMKHHSEFVPYIKHYSKLFAVKFFSSDFMSSFQKGIDQVRYIWF